MKARAAAPDVLVDLADLGELRDDRLLGRRDARDRRDGHLRAARSPRRRSTSRGRSSPRWRARSPTSRCATAARSAATSASNDPTNHLPPLLVALGATITIAGGRRADGRRRRVLPRRLLDGGRRGRAADAGSRSRRASRATATASRGRRIGADGTCIVNAAATVVDGSCVSRSAASTPCRCVRRSWRSVSPAWSSPTRRCAPRSRPRRPRPAVRRPRVGRVPPASRRGVRGARSRSGAPSERRDVTCRAPSTGRTISVEVNGESYEREVPARRLLVHFLRDDLGLTGTHIGCDTGNCGACTVHLRRHGDQELHDARRPGRRRHDRRPSRGWPADGELTPLQRSFYEHHALQCGYCTPGMLMSATALLDSNPHPTEDEIRRASRATSAAAPAT